MDSLLAAVLARLLTWAVEKTAEKLWGKKRVKKRRVEEKNMVIRETSTGCTVKFSSRLEHEE
jgi:hypothetical protein